MSLFDPDTRAIRAAAVALVAALVVPLPLVRAATLAGVDMPEQASVAGKALILNGLGMRTATFLKVKVYVIGLYLERKSSDARAIIDSGQAKRVAIRFLHEVTAAELRKGWSEAFENNFPDVAGIKDEIARFNAAMRDVKSGDSIVLEIYDSTVDVLVNGEKVDAVDGSAFQKAALSIWLGKKPPNDALKDGILGN
jgi:hypothetical protein